jgi:hypothetical protein
VSSSYAAWRARLAEANDPKFWPIEALDRLVEEGDAQFWADNEGALLTRMVSYPGGAITVETLAGAGTIEALAAMTPAINDWALTQGATHLLVLGRPGWARALTGWRHHQSILIKEVAHG